MAIQFSGGTIINTTFTANGKALIQSNVVSQLGSCGWSQVTGYTGGGSATVTLTIASPGVVNLAGHGLLANDGVVFQTTGALPTGLTAGTRYYVKTVLSSSTFTVSTTSGGTVINFTGSQSGTQTMIGAVRMLSATTPGGVACRIRMQDNGGNCITFSIEDSTSTTIGGNSTTDGAFMLPSATAYRIVACQYQAFIYLPSTTQARGYVAFGTPYIPSFLTPTECGWIQGNTNNDADTSVTSSFRTAVTMGGSSGNYQAIIGGNLLDNTSTTNASGAVAVVQPGAPGTGAGGGAVYASGQTGTHWGDASAFMMEPLIMWGSTSTSGEPLIRGQLWNAVVICDTFVADTTTSFDGHTWICVTDNNSAGNCSIFVATS